MKKSVVFKFTNDDISSGIRSTQLFTLAYDKCFICNTVICANKEGRIQFETETDISNDDFMIKLKEHLNKESIQSIEIISVINSHNI